MKQLTHLLLLSLLLPGSAFTADTPLPPPPPPNPFSNLPSNGSEPFTPFDDDFDEYAAPGGAYPDDFAAGRASGGGGARPTESFSPPGGGGSPSRPSGGRAAPPSSSGFASGGKNSRLPPPATCKETVENFDYPDAEILDVAKAIAKLTGKNFIYNPQDIKGRISVVSQTQITVCDAWNAFLTSLNIKGFAIVPSGKYLRIERIASAKEKQTPIYSEKQAPNNDEFITRVIPLRYIDATEFESAFRLWMPREARMQAYQQTNTIIITDTATHINRMMELIGLLDVAGYQESLVVMPIHNAAAKDIAKLIESILNERSAGGGGGGFGMPPRPGNPYGMQGGRTGTRGRAGGSTISKIIADDRTNSLIVKANAAGLQEIRALVRRLDTKVAVAEGSGRIHVVSLRFANAEELSKVLQNITSGASSSKSSGGNRAFPAWGEAPQTFQNDIKVSPDKTTQSLVITASPQDFASMKKVIDRLDQPRDQVFLEAMILEMSLNRDNAFGVSFFNAVNGLALNSASGNLQNIMTPGKLPSGFVLGMKSGRSVEVQTGDSSNTRLNVSSFQGLFELIQANTDAQVIATPQIIALDNEKATFEVSEQVPVEKTTTSNGVPVTSFEPDKASLTLVVTPQINKGSNFVKLEIDQKLENFDPTNVPIDLRGRATGKNSRSTNTKVFVQSDDTVVLSGMIRNQVQEVINKVPILGDIPVLGWLFKNSSTKNRKSNLMVFITPRIVKQYDKMRKILAKKLDERDEFVHETQGSIDPFGREVNRLKKSLPDLTVIEPIPQHQPLESSSFQGPAGPDRDDGDDYYDPGYYDPVGPGGPIPLEGPLPSAPPPYNYDGGAENFPPPAAIPQNVSPEVVSPQ
ncbi:MAG TPA: type II secretion system secretin GspD [Bdellovibrionota bacterium]|jgi:general secretion pathway protein D